MPHERLKVLLIEHDPGFARQVGEMLGKARDLSADLQPASDLNTGLSALRGDNFDVVMLDMSVPEGGYLMANAALARIYGYGSPEELIQGLTDISRKLYVQEGRRDEFIRLMQEHDTITDFESQVYRKDGAVIWISENCRAIRDGRGRLLYYEGTVEDISHRRQVEERLRNSEALYHSLVETLPQNIFRKDLQGHF